MIATKPKIKFNHRQLVRVARRWLTERCVIVTTELSSMAGEEPDALGFDSGGTTHLIECKASLSDFRADAEKMHRQHSSIAIGRFRYYLVPAELAERIEVPDQFGLLTWDGRFIKVRKSAQPFAECHERRERMILISLMRRMRGCDLQGVAVRCYAIDKNQQKPRATLGIMPEE